MESATLLLNQLGGYMAKLAHVFGAIIWIGGVLFMAGVATPILKYYAQPEHADPHVEDVIAKLEERLIGFHWMALGTVLISGFVLTLYSSDFFWFRFENRADWVVHLKIFLWIPIAFVNYLLALSYRELRVARDTKEGEEDLSPREITGWRIVSLRRINIYLAFLIIILVAML